MSPARKQATAEAHSVTLVTPTARVRLPWPAVGSKKLGQLQQRMIEWTHIVRNRTRWVRSKSGGEEQDQRARDLLRDLGVSEAERHTIANAGTVTVSIPFAHEEIGWESRIFPWEYVLSAGTRDLRSGGLLVARWLVTNTASRATKTAKVLFVESAPGRLGSEWDFADERKLVKRYAKADTFDRLVSPTLDELAAAVARLRPDVIHLAGFDTHQGLELARDPRAADTADGYLLAGPGGGVEPVTTFALADALTPGRYAPSVVFCNIWNSSARVAPLMVAAGAGAVISYQDSIDDAFAEIFLGNFYRTLTETQDVDTAFEGGWASLMEQRKSLRGTGIVLWHGGAERQLTAHTARRAGTPATVVERQTLVPSSMSAAQVAECIAVSVEPEPQISYGLLHNNRDLFRKFLIRNLNGARILRLEVFVELHSNDGTYPFRQSFTLDGPVLDLSREIRIALTSSLARTLDEVLRTSLYVGVTWGDHQIFSQTFPVTLAPVDQWADTDMDRSFLPSFVFPRDQAVRTVIRNAEHYVTALRDDPAAGFDGYQSIDPELVNPAENVDRQVQALWYSVIYKVPASYINPPPTYAVMSQRIRTPTEVVSGGFGTCIDLALMVAASLEAVEIYPVVFLLNDHAFPGYWRTDAARDAFLRRIAKLAATPGRQDRTGDGSAARERPGVPWAFDVTAVEEIKRSIGANALVPLESVGLTGRWSLSAAIEEGRGYFSDENADRFLSMLDVVTAREHGVTPLPLGARLG
ncbi:MAG: hypothetical protein V4617_17885 [Gemmatimonadota bacterium]